MDESASDSFITFKDVDGTTFDSAFDMLKFVISQICIEYSYLEQGDTVSDAYKEILND